MNYALAFVAYLSIPVYVATTAIQPVPEAQAEAPQEQPAEEAEPPSIQIEVLEEPEPKTIDELIDEHFGKQATNARKVMACESGGRPDAVGDKHLSYLKDGIKYGESYGLFQIRYLPGRPSPEELLDQEFNIKYAAAMQQDQGWGPWTCSRKVGIR